MEKWPIYFKDRLIISNDKSPICIATLWTPKEAIEKMIDSESYYILGQLYTKKGINYILRNILANPKITKIYLVGSDLMESGEAFLKFMEKGIDGEHNVIGDDSAKIEEQISIEALDSFRDNVKIIDLRGPQNLKNLKDIIENDKVSQKGYWRDPQIFPDPPKPQISRYPSEIDLIKVRRPTISDAYVSILHHVMKFGLDSEPVMNYASDTSNTMKEVLNLTTVITDENPNKPVITDELPFNQNDLDNYMNGFFNPDRGTEDYSYGERLFNYANEEIDALKKIYPWLEIDRFQKYFPEGGIDQVAISIVRKLQSFQYDKGAIALLGNPFTDVFPRRPSKKIPCLFLIQCQVYQGALTLTAYFRSNDMYNAWALNAFALRKLQYDIAEKLDVKAGNLITISNMAHIYEHNFSDADEIIEKHKTGNCEWDPRGNLNYSIEGDEIVAKLVSPDGNLELNEWRISGHEDKASNKLSFQIESDLGISVLGNAADMGRQIERAQTAIRLGLEFRQDNGLDFSVLKNS